MISIDEVRRIALGFPGVEEGKGVPAARRLASFKVGGKGFLGIEVGERTITLSLGEPEARALDGMYPGHFEEIWRMGRTFAGIRVDLPREPPGLVRDLIERSWRHRAPKRLVAAYDASASSDG